ncbi:BnaC07g50540D [Brassica napus]|uniref:Uncharacterized protein n=2 Tax=Brassica TaxID=3705 RepID=A0A3P6CE58_BRAOL|nr:unnamed protein product [Brassica napus]CDY65252.1 BnaC07g50540D [Brassica napus]VDD13696.1 unnamed protein product [Brassica oleracea]
MLTKKTKNQDQEVVMKMDGFTLEIYACGFREDVYRLLTGALIVIHCFTSNYKCVGSQTLTPLLYLNRESS